MSRHLQTSIQVGAVYHVISRFVAQQWFIAGVVERMAYLRLLGGELLKTNWSCISYAVMSNHIHLALVAGTQPLASWLRPAHTDFAQWINERSSRIGAVFVRGPNIIDVHPGGVPRLMAYIHRNPVRAGVVAMPDETDWTSHLAYLGQIEAPRWLDVERGLALCGAREPRDLHRFVCDADVRREDLEDIRVVARKPRGRPVRGIASAA